MRYYQYSIPQLVWCNSRCFPLTSRIICVAKWKIQKSWFVGCCHRMLSYSSITRLWSYAKLAIKNLDLFESAADEIVKRGQSHSRHLDNVWTPEGHIFDLSEFFCEWSQQVSNTWLERHRTSPTPFGPMEWLYQSLDIWWLHCSTISQQRVASMLLDWAWDVSSWSSSSSGSTWFNREAAYNQMNRSIEFGKHGKSGSSSGGENWRKPKLQQTIMNIKYKHRMYQIYVIIKYM